MVPVDHESQAANGGNVFSDRRVVANNPKHIKKTMTSLLGPHLHRSCLPAYQIYSSPLSFHLSTLPPPDSVDWRRPPYRSLDTNHISCRMKSSLLTNNSKNHISCRMKPSLLTDKSKNRISCRMKLSWLTITFTSSEIVHSPRARYILQVCSHVHF